MLTAFGVIVATMSKKNQKSFPPDSTIEARAIHSRGFLVAQCAAGGVLFGLITTFFIGLIGDVHILLRIVAGLLVGYGFYRLIRGDVDDGRYDSISFNRESMIVHFHSRPQMDIAYKDIVEVRTANENFPTTLTITGNYPVLFLGLYELENKMDQVLLRYLKTTGVG